MKRTYTFQRDLRWKGNMSSKRVATHAVNVVHQAIDDPKSWSYKEITGHDAEEPHFCINFPNDVDLAAFQNRLEIALKRNGISIITLLQSE